ncbi:DNA polymerase III subunit alpha [Clostridium sp.]|uniref:DNA polymerase III subunit alpha n=1 Tax=Clostridium sp. TaxID=1506 RepID=UPI001A566E82|nr:DNA polymerase III subunit alpha [Clostridium sp.]MBK5234075.1 DNA polymerase III subunit alpha [Clostridium sp.]
MIDLHRHDEFSTFDGFGKAKELAELAKELGHTSLGTSNHGNSNGLIQTYYACQEVGIKPVLGIEGYFLPKHKPQTRGFHLCLFAKNLKGYGNLNKIQYAGDAQKYYNPIWDFKILEEFKEGLICTSACVASYSSQCIIKDRVDLAEKYLIEMKRIFGDDFYLEIQPYKISEPEVQEKVNLALIKLGKKLSIKCILTSDSHRGRKDDLDTYMKMHEVANHNFFDVKETYGERYMPTESELTERFVLMHQNDLPHLKKNKLSRYDFACKMSDEMMENLEEIEAKVEDNILDALPLELPIIEGVKDSTKKMMDDIKQGLKDRGKYNKEYLARCKKEFGVIHYHGFEDYFLIVADYVKWAKNEGIVVGPGRGSVCNSLVAYALKITEVDSLLFELDFRRFLRKDKTKFPDIDLDFETSRRYEVIEYMCEKYKGQSARIASYGLYKVDNLVNDLAKVCGLETIGKTLDDDRKNQHKRVIVDIKGLVREFIADGVLDKGILNDRRALDYNDRYDNIIKHFSKLYLKMRFMGTHAAGVAITSGNLLDYVALRSDKNGDMFTNYNLEDLEDINVIKFDVLGLKTMESIGDLRSSTGITCDYDSIVQDKKIMENFKDGNCDGIFQFEKATARRILNNINCDCFADVVAASSMNRPGPLSLHMPEQYAENKYNPTEARESDYWDYTKESYGTIIYQEQIQQICVNIGQMSWGETDKIMKSLKGFDATDPLIVGLMETFTAGAIQNGMTKTGAIDLFQKLLAYSFNKGHAVGYSLISVEEMFYKVYHPNEYWFSKIKYAKNEGEYYRFCTKASTDKAVIFLPHVNYSEPMTTLREVDGERVIQQGLSDIKNIGDKAAAFIYKEKIDNGIFISYDDFYDRCKNRAVTSRVIDELMESGALEFSKHIYIKRIIKYNSALCARGANG